MEKLIFYMHILSPIIGLAFNVVTQILVCRYIKRKGLLQSVYLGFLGGICSIALIELWYYYATIPTMTESLCQFLLNLATFTVLGYCYFHFINLGETARRIRLVRELQEAGKGLSYDEITAKYGAPEIITKRLNRMLKNNQLILKNDRYIIAKPHLLFMAKLLVLLKILFLKKSSEHPHD